MATRSVDFILARLSTAMDFQPQLAFMCNDVCGFLVRNYLFMLFLSEFSMDQ